MDYTNTKDKEQQSAKNENEEMSHFDKIYNLIILDMSGSMSRIKNAVISGFNETIDGIRTAQEEFKETQKHFVSLMVFCDCNKRMVYDCVPVSEVSTLTDKEYQPCCCTPLYDAMGISLTKLSAKIKEDENATAVVTVITDGLENASKEYNGAQIKSLVEELKALGWTFAYMGTNHDVESVSNELSFENVHRFNHDEQGMNEGWMHENYARMAFCTALSKSHNARRAMPRERRKSFLKEFSSHYYDKQNNNEDK